MSSWPATLPAFPVGSSGALAAFTDRSHGEARETLRAGPFHWLEQVHGCEVVMVEAGDSPGRRGDGLVSKDPLGLAVMVADCAPVLMAGREVGIAALHCGWRSLAGGLVVAALDAMTRIGARDVEAVVGPCICPRCYEFGEEDLSAVSRAVGADEELLRSRSAKGLASLDLRAMVRLLLERQGVRLVAEDPRCTSCDPGLFSARARSDRGRQAGLIWRPEWEEGSG